MKTIWKYTKLYKSFLKANFQAELEYRTNIILRFIADIFWYVGHIITFEALFQHTDQLGGWSAPQMRVFLGVLFIVDSFYMFFFHNNFDAMSEKIRKGELDLLLTKPVNSQFMMSVLKPHVAAVANLVIAISWLTWAILQIQAPWYNALALLLVLPAGLLCLYAIRLIIATTAVIFVKSEYLTYLWYQLYKFGTRPDTIYFPWMRFLFLTILPVGMIASVPARFVLGEGTWPLAVWSIVLAILLFEASRRFWNLGLKHYGSASS